jgi:hypothetical protein
VLRWSLWTPRVDGAPVLLNAHAVAIAAVYAQIKYRQALQGSSLTSPGQGIARSSCGSRQSSLPHQLRPQYSTIRVMDTHSSSSRALVGLPAGSGGGTGTETVIAAAVQLTGTCASPAVTAVAMAMTVTRTQARQHSRLAAVWLTWRAAAAPLQAVLLMQERQLRQQSFLSSHARL